MQIKSLAYALLSLVVLILGGFLVIGWMSLPSLDGKVRLAGLQNTVAVAADGFGVPTLTASSREDALRALGWIHARDRLFQMELMRRKSAGRLAELFGAGALDLDRRQRSYGFEAAAAAIVAALPDNQKRALAAYADGINAFLEQVKVLPPEFLLLRHNPDPWRPVDSLLVGLGMFQTLNSGEEEERMLSVMAAALPQKVFEFLTPDSDQYDTVLLGGRQSRRPARPLPAAEWAELGQAQVAEAGVDAVGSVAGSNNWAVSGARTRDGRAILADDMHLSLGVPNIWYRAALRYAGRRLDGLTLPGLPLLIVGNNGHVAWGFTNVEADVTDLVRLEINPANPDEYLTPRGWRAFDRRWETFRVRGGAEKREQMQNTIWGPVSPNTLMGRTVAIRWTALQASGVDLGLLDMERAETLERALDVMNRSAGPTQNVVMADDKGRIAWTLMGRYPLRQGFDGTISQSWADGRVGWNGYIPPEQLPRLVDPPQGYIATANNRTLGRDYPHVIGHNQANGYRAYRISRRLAELKDADESDLFAIQLDTRSEFFDLYRTLALGLLRGDVAKDPELEEARRDIEAWNGRMDADSRGIGLLWRFREKLVGQVFAPVIVRCRRLEPTFVYAWRQMETPLRALLEQQDPLLLPDSRYRDWRQLMRQALIDSARELKQQHSVEALTALTWGEINKVPIRHPFSTSMPFLSPFLDMADKAVSGCSGFCVRIVGKGHGASERMVVSPGNPENGILHMPAGQSGHPMSPHYRDQHPAWRQGVPLPFEPGEQASVLELVP